MCYVPTAGKRFVNRIIVNRIFVKWIPASAGMTNRTNKSYRSEEKRRKLSSGKLCLHFLTQELPKYDEFAGRFCCAMAVAGFTVRFEF